MGKQETWILCDQNTAEKLHGVMGIAVIKAFR